jgi:hypothetical protein
MTRATRRGERSSPGGTLPVLEDKGVSNLTAAADNAFMVKLVIENNPFLNSRVLPRQRHFERHEGPQGFIYRRAVEHRAPYRALSAWAIDGGYGHSDNFTFPRQCHRVSGPQGRSPSAQGCC